MINQNDLNLPFKLRLPSLKELSFVTNLESEGKSTIKQ